MPGSPKKRARRVRDGGRDVSGQSRARSVTDGTVTSALRRVAAGESAAAVARDLGVSADRVRKWVARDRARPESESVLALDAAARREADGLSRVERLRRAADRAWEASSSALEQGDLLMAQGSSSDARNGAVLSGVWAERAKGLAEEARLEELHEVELSRANGELVAAVIEQAFALVDLPCPKLVLAALLVGGEPDGAVVDAARLDVRRRIAAEARVELLAELEEERLARPAYWQARIWRAIRGRLSTPRSCLSPRRVSPGMTCRLSGNAVGIRRWRSTNTRTRSVVRRTTLGVAVRRLGGAGSTSACRRFSGAEVEGLVSLSTCVSVTRSSSLGIAQEGRAEPRNGPHCPDRSAPCPRLQ